MPATQLGQAEPETTLLVFGRGVAPRTSWRARGAHHRRSMPRPGADPTMRRLGVLLRGLDSGSIGRSRVTCWAGTAAVAGTNSPRPRHDADAFRRPRRAGPPGHGGVLVAVPEPFPTRGEIHHDELTEQPPSDAPVAVMDLKLAVEDHSKPRPSRSLGSWTWPPARNSMPSLVDLVDRGFHQLTADLEQVSFLDCAGIGMLVDARRRVQAHGGSLEAGQAETHCAAGAGADRDGQRCSRDRPSFGEATTPTTWPTCCRIPRGPSCPPPAQPRGLQPSSGRWWRCWPLPGRPNRPGAIALVERVCAELGSNAEIHMLDITDQQAAEQACSLGALSGPTAATSSRAPRNASNTCTPVGSTVGKQPCAGFPEEIWLRQALQAAQA